MASAWVAPGDGNTVSELRASLQKFSFWPYQERLARKPREFIVRAMIFDDFQADRCNHKTNLVVKDLYIESERTDEERILTALQHVGLIYKRQGRRRRANNHE